MRRLILHFKYSQGIQLAKPLADRFFKQLTLLDVPLSEGILVPVPDHFSRRRERLYNPAELLAVKLNTITHLPLDPSLVKRIHAGPHQSKLQEEERKKGLKNAFFAKAPVNKTQRMIIVDDVIATGTTLSRIARAARKAGWKHVDAIVLSG